MRYIFAFLILSIMIGLPYTAIQFFGLQKIFSLSEWVVDLFILTEAILGFFVIFCLVGKKD